jgi:hypothetical protein
LPKKIKPTRYFNPLPKDEGDEFFRNGIFEFNVTKLRAFIADHPEQFFLEQVSVISLSRVTKGLDEPAVQFADPTKPVILAEMSPGNFNVIDGNHGVEKAHRQGQNKVLAYCVPAKVHVSFLTSESSYRAYVAYWNSKISAVQRLDFINR